MKVNGNASGTFSQTSPVPSFRHLSPYLSPLIDSSHQEHSFHLTDLSAFKLEHYDDYSILNPAFEDALVNLDVLVGEKGENEEKESEIKLVTDNEEHKGKKRCLIENIDSSSYESKI